MGALCLSLFCCALFCVLSRFEIICKRMRELVALILLSYGCLVTVNVLSLLLKVHRDGLRCVLVVFLIIFIYFFMVSILLCKSEHI